MIYLLLSFSIGIGGGTFIPQGEDIVSPSYGVNGSIYYDIEVIPDLVYSLSLSMGKAGASTETMTYQIIQQGDSTIYVPVSDEVGDNFEYVEGNLSVQYSPFELSVSPFISGRIGLMKWKFTDESGVVNSLTGNKFDRLSLSLGGGFGLETDILEDYTAGVLVNADFILSVDSDMEEGFGPADDNEWKYGISLKVARRF